MFSSGPIGVTLANLVCRIFALLKQLWLWIVASNAFGMTFDISLWIKIVKMQLLLLARRALHQPTANSPSIERIMEDDLEENGNDEKFFCFFCDRDFKTKQGCIIHQRNCDEAHWFEIDTIQLDTVHFFAKWIKLFDCVFVQHSASTMPVGCNYSTVAITAIK